MTAFINTYVENSRGLRGARRVNALYNYWYVVDLIVYTTCTTYIVHNMQFVLCVVKRNLQQHACTYTHKHTHAYTDAHTHTHTLLLTPHHNQVL